jgi:UDP-glucose 4-epimerase
LKILVAGASGNLGFKLCEDLNKKGHHVYGLIRPGSQHNDFFEKIEMDIRQIDLKKLPIVDCIYYLAQSKFYREFPQMWEDIYEINISAPLKLIDWARKNSIPAFHYASSGGVYQGGVAAVRESAEINANRDVGFYIGSRLSAEILMRNFASYFKTFSIIRPFFIFGPRQPRTMLIPRLIDSVKNGKEITLNGENGIKINPIYVNDASIACTNLLKLEGFYSLNIAGPEILSMRDIANEIGSVFKKQPVFRIIEDNGQDLVGNTDLMFKLLHKPTRSLRENLLDMEK